MHERKKSQLKVFFSYFRPHWKLFALDLSCGLLVSIIDLLFPSVSRWCLYTLLPENAFGAFWRVMLIVLVAYLIRTALSYIVWSRGHYFGIRVEADMRRDLFAHMQSLSYEYYDANRTGQLMSRLTTDLFDISELAHHGPEDVFVSCVTIIGSLIIMFTIEPRLALVLALMIPLFFAIIWQFRRQMSRASKRVKVTTANINADFEAGVSGMKTAKAFANEDLEMRKFNEANDSYRNSKKDFHRAMGKFNSTMEFFTCMLSVVVIAVGGVLIMSGDMNVIDLVTFSLYVSVFVTPVRRLSTLSELLANGFAGLSRFFEIMHTEPSLKDAEDAVALSSCKGDIDIEDVSFSYFNHPEVLHDVNLKIKSGETIAFVGPSGGGKTTLSRLIPRFYDVTQGSIKIDGIDVRKIKQESLHEKIGVVQQDVFLFPATIMENIRYGKEDATDEEVAEAARKAEIFDDVMAMPDGFNSQAGERGVLLSGGQKQRISIARIFLKNPPVLILDEATSALDSVTEARIQETFDKLAKGRTTIIIAHRLSTVRNADKIAVIDKGRITEYGSHDELIKKDGEYAALIRAQAFKGDI